MLRVAVTGVEEGDRRWSIPTGNRLDSVALKMEAARFPETSMPTNDATRFRNPECSHNIGTFLPDCLGLFSEII